MNRDEILRILREQRDELRREYGVKSLALFGSVARDEATDASDIDLLVEFERPIGLFELIGAQQHIEDLLGVAKVDLVLRHSVIQELKEDIFREAINVFEAPEVETPPAAGG
jgi:hypothetical protein